LPPSILPKPGASLYTPSLTLTAAGRMVVGSCGSAGSAEARPRAP
jgi:hypothetical protein